ncbi:hypothetical protein, partial [Nocardia asiatica]|uniref:hypothetical protein n=1 Tax=Nocardia asiatica TaxID=209252 RepID=UPI0024554256
MIGLTLPEIRRLTIALALGAALAAPATCGPGRTGADDDNTKPADPTTDDEDTHSPDCRCST